MTRYSYRSKIVIGLIVLAVFYGATFGYIYPVIDKKNAALVTDVEAHRKEFEELQSEKRSYELGQRDIILLKDKPIQPTGLFSTDKQVVSAVKLLEQIATESGVEFSLQVSGTVSSGIKAVGTGSDILTIGYTMKVVGAFGDIVTFIERVEHVPFVTHVQRVSLAASEESVIATLNAQFYLKK